MAASNSGGIVHPGIDVHLFFHSYSTITGLTQHLQSTHGYSVHIETITFPDFTSFLAWKGEKETRKHSIMYKNVLHKPIAISNTGTTTATVQVNIKGEQTVFDSQKDKVLAN